MDGEKQRVFHVDIGRENVAGALNKKARRHDTGESEFTMLSRMKSSVVSIKRCLEKLGWSYNVCGSYLNF